MVRKEGYLKLYQVDDSVFFPLSDNYLVYLCKKETLDRLTEEETLELIVKMLREARMARPVTLH